MTTAREIADWHRAEAQRLKAERIEPANVPLFIGGVAPHTASLEPVFNHLDRIKLHERFAAWLESVLAESRHGL